MATVQPFSSPIRTRPTKSKSTHSFGQTTSLLYPFGEQPLIVRSETFRDLGVCLCDVSFFLLLLLFLTEPGRQDLYTTHGRTPGRFFANEFYQSVAKHRFSEACVSNTMLSCLVLRRVLQVRCIHWTDNDGWLGGWLAALARMEHSFSIRSDVTEWALETWTINYGFWNGVRVVSWFKRLKRRCIVFLLHIEAVDPNGTEFNRFMSW